jgi:NAD(P)-dependent dehydrogenase (short-subunit alcohol dehydrogenase family)
VRIDKNTGKARIYPSERFKQVIDVNLVAPVYWALEMIGRIAENRAACGLRRWQPEEGMQGAIVFIGSVSSQGNKGQISYASAKAGLEGAAATIMKEAVFHGVRCGVIHPGFTDTPMVRAMGDDYISKNILPFTQLSRLSVPRRSPTRSASCPELAVSGDLGRRRLARAGLALPVRGCGSPDSARRHCAVTGSGGRRRESRGVRRADRRAANQARFERRRVVQAHA